MSKLGGTETFQERLEKKRKSLLSQREEVIKKEIEKILLGLDSSLTETEKNELHKSAKLIAENKHYEIDDKLKIISNIEDNQRFIATGDDKQHSDRYGEIKDDIVYQRMNKIGDLENIKLFFERKLPLDVYYSYLTEDEIKNLGNENIGLLNDELINGNVTNEKDSASENEKSLDDEKMIDTKLKELLKNYKSGMTINISKKDLELDGDELKDLVIRKFYRLGRFSLERIKQEKFISYFKKHSEIDIKKGEGLDLYIVTDSINELIHIKFNSQNGEGQPETCNISEGVLDEYRTICENINSLRNRIAGMRNPQSLMLSLQGNMIDKLGETANDRIKDADEQYTEEINEIGKKIASLIERKHAIEEKYPQITEYFKKLNAQKKTSK